MNGQTEAVMAQAERLYQAGRLTEAAAILERLCLEKDTRAYARYCCVFGSVLAESGHLVRAIELFERARDFHDGRGDWGDLGLVYFNLANTHSYAGASDIAFECLSKAIDCFERVSARGMLITAHLTSGNWLAGAEEFDRAAEHLDKVDLLLSSEPVDNEALEWSLCLLRGKVALGKKNNCAALDSLQTSLDVARRSGATQYVIESQFVLAQVLSQLGQADEARERLLEAKQLLTQTDHAKALSLRARVKIT